MNKNFKLELCCGRIEDCKLAEKHRVTRIELNNALELGGMTPSYGLFNQAISYDISVIPMVRPVVHTFNYSEDDFKVMQMDSTYFLENGADGIVFGILDEKDEIDIERTKILVNLCHSYGKEAVFHKAFDETNNLEKSIKILINLGVDRVLTGGGLGSISDNIKSLSDLNNKYGEQITILPGGGVTEKNIKKFLSLGFKELHMTAKKDLPYADEKHLNSILKIIDREEEEYVK